MTETAAKGSEATRERVLAAARALLAQHGTTGTGLNQIVEESGVSYGSIYNQFKGGKDELVSSAITSAGDEVANNIEQVLAASPALNDAVDMIFAYGASLLLDSDFERGCPIGTAVGDGHGVESIRSAAAETFARCEEMVATRAVELGASHGDAGDFASAVISLYEGALLLSRTHHTIEPMQAASRIASGLITQIVP